MKNYKKNHGFSLAEVLVSLLLVSTMLAATMPLITKKTSTGTPTTPWQYTDSGQDIYYGTSNTDQFIGIGSNKPKYKLQIGELDSNNDAITGHDTSIIAIGDVAPETSNPAEEAPTINKANAFLWLPHYGSIRAGHTENHWNDANMGVYSVAFGSQNTASGNMSTVSGGSSNKAENSFAVVAGGQNNTASAEESSVLGGNCNEANKEEATIAGGENNLASGQSSFIGGGGGNTASGEYSVIAGGGDRDDNTHNGGGYGNQATNTYAFIGSGHKNTASGQFAIVSGGRTNKSSGYHSIVSGGSYNEASGDYSFIGNGNMNTVEGEYSFIGNGSANTVEGDYSSILGGSGNTIDTGSDYCLVAGQNMNVTGNNIYAFGQASSTHNFLTSDTFNIYGNGDNTNQVLQVTGGGNFTGNLTTSFLQVLGTSTFGDDATFEDKVTFKSNTTFEGTVYIDGKSVIDSGGTWTTSDRRLKNVLGSYNKGLDEILRLKTYKFTYKNDKEKQLNTGIMAQDVQPIFPEAVKEHKKHLVVNKDPIFYAMVNSIQELNSKNEKLNKENKELKAQLFELTKRVENIEKLNHIQTKENKNIFIQFWNWIKNLLHL